MKYATSCSRENVSGNVPTEMEKFELIMKITFALFFTLFSLCAYSQNELSAEEYILSEITKIENYLLGKNNNLDLKTPNEIVCFTLSHCWILPPFAVLKAATSTNLPL